MNPNPSPEPTDLPKLKAEAEDWLNRRDGIEGIPSIDLVRRLLDAVEGLEKELQEARQDVHLSHADLVEMMDVLGISTHARPDSPHEVFQREVLPEMRRLLPDGEYYRRAGMEEVERGLKLEEQIKRLADFIMEEVPGEPSQSEGAVDTAIRVMQQERQKTAALRSAMSKYGRHLKGCDFNATSLGEACTCGFGRVLAQLTEAPTE